MLPAGCFDWPTQHVQIEPGALLLRRAASVDWAIYLDAGRVSLGLLSDGQLDHLLGVAQGPSWLEVSAVLLDLPSLVDAVAQTPVALRRLPAATLRASLQTLPTSAQSVLHDVAAAHRQQTELALSRIAQDAQARCAEWLLRHAQTDERGVLAVALGQRKRQIAAQLGMAPETLSRVLRHLRERSLISGSGRIVNLLNPVGLRLLAGL